MKRMLLLILPCVLLMGLIPPATAETTTSASPYTDVDLIPVSIEFISCSGEPISASGEYLSVTHWVIGADGRVFQSGTGRWRNITGISPSGVTYRILVGGHFTINVRSLATIYTSTVQFNLISANGDPNLLATGVLHTTILASGKVTVWFDDHFRYQCVG